MRLAEAGPWWDHAERPGLTRTRQEQDELDGLEATLADADDRALLQRTARGQLTAEHEPLTRLSVARRACRLLEQQTSRAGAASLARPERGRRCRSQCAYEQTRRARPREHVLWRTSGDRNRRGPPEVQLSPRVTGMTSMRNIPLRVLSTVE